MTARERAIHMFNNPPRIRELDRLLKDESELSVKRASAAIMSLYVDNWNDDIVIHKSAPYSVIHVALPPLHSPKGMVVVEKTFWTQLVEKFHSFKASIRLRIRAYKARRAFLKAS